MCGADGCGSATADLKCGRCQGVFYCDSDCQKADWKRHKGFCKSATAFELSVEHGIAVAPISTNAADAQLADLIRRFIEAVDGYPKLLKKLLPPTLAKAKGLFAKGARPHVRVQDKTGSFSASVLAYIIISAKCPGLEVLLKAMLQADVTRPVNLYAGFPLGGDPFCPLQYCILSARPSYARVLLDCGLDVSRPCWQQKGALMWPVGACCGVTGVDGVTAERILQILDMLIAAGADVNAFDARFMEGNDNGVSYFCPLVSLLVDVCDNPAEAATQTARALKLLQAGADFNMRDRHQKRPLDYAAEAPSLSIFKALIAKGADPSPVPFVVQVGLPHRDHELVGAHYLELAARNGRSDVLQAAADAGVQLRCVKALLDGATPLLMLPARFHHPACVKVLLEQSADLNECLCRRGATNATEPIWWTPLDAALASDSSAQQLAPKAEETLNMIVAAGGKTFERLQAERREGGLNTR